MLWADFFPHSIVYWIQCQILVLAKMSRRREELATHTILYLYLFSIGLLLLSLAVPQSAVQRIEREWCLRANTCDLMTPTRDSEKFSCTAAYCTSSSTTSSLARQLAIPQATSSNRCIDVWVRHFFFHLACELVLLVSWSRFFHLACESFSFLIDMVYSLVFAKIC